MSLPNPIHKQRLLFLLPFVPSLHAVHGGGRAMAQLLAHLAPRHDVALLYLRAAYEPPLDDALRAQCTLVEEVQRPNHQRTPARRWLHRGRLFEALLRGTPMWATDWAVPAFAARARVLAQTWCPDIVQIEYHIMAQYIGALRECPAPRVLIEHEPGMDAARNVWRTRRAAGRALSLVDMVAWARFERAILKQVQAVVVFTDRDRDMLAALAPHTRIIRIPLGTTLPQHPLSAVGTPPLSLLFVGNFVHPPNIEAAERLAGTIFPQVRARHPDLMLYVVGDRPPLPLRRMANTHVVVTGRVPNVTPYLDHAAIVVVPLSLGGGMRVKVLEALAAGKAVVASPLAVEGLDLIDGEHFRLAESDQQFCDAINQLLTDPQQRAALGARARAWACANLGWQQSITAYENLYQRLLDGSV